MIRFDDDDYHHEEDSELVDVDNTTALATIEDSSESDEISHIFPAFASFGSNGGHISVAGRNNRHQSSNTSTPLLFDATTVNGHDVNHIHRHHEQQDNDNDINNNNDDDDNVDFFVDNDNEDDIGFSANKGNSIVVVAATTVRKLLSGDLHTHCEFDVRHLDEYSPQLGRAFECYDELIDTGSESNSSTCDDNIDDNTSEYVDANNNRNRNQQSGPANVPIRIAATAEEEEANDGDNVDDDDESDSCDSCDHCASDTRTGIEMRETGQLRGLLKNPNRPPPAHKNRVVFDETQNKFFDADYIILIREDCPYDEEDEEPCTCGEHELVRLCCEEGCQCAAYGGGGDDTRTPQVSDILVGHYSCSVVCAGKTVSLNPYGFNNVCNRLLQLVM